MTTFSAVSGPLLATCKVQVTSSPSSGVSLSTDFSIWRSASGSGSGSGSPATALTLAIATLFSKFDSSVSLLTIPILVCIASASVTTVVICSKALSPLARSPISHTPASALKSPMLAVSSTYSTPAGRLSLTTTFTASSGPLLVTIKVHTTSPLRAGVGLLTSFTICKSAPVSSCRSQ